MLINSNLYIRVTSICLANIADITLLNLVVVRQEEEMTYVECVYEYMCLF